MYMSPIQGTKVFIPTWYRLAKHKFRFCLVDKIFNVPGRQYARLIGITSRGVSKSDSQVTYWPLSALHSLEIVSNVEVKVGNNG